MASGSGWNLWVWLLGVVLSRYIDFLILLIPTPLVSVLFCSSIPTFLFILKIKIYIYQRNAPANSSKRGSLRLAPNIRPMRYCTRIESVSNARRQQLRTAREQTIATESTEERQTRLQQLRSAQQQRISAETQEEREARLQQLTTAQQQDC